MTDFNESIIEEFRAHGGRVGGQFDGAPLLLLHTVGAKTGQERVTPVMYQDLGGSYAIFASLAGAPVNPAWYHNLLANPQTKVEIGTQVVPVVARIADPVERAPIWAKQKADYSGFADYESQTSRIIPVVILDPNADSLTPTLETESKEEHAITQQTFIVVGTFVDDVDMTEVAALVPDEMVKVEQLRAEGRMGAVHIALARETVFMEVSATDETDAVNTVLELPLGKFFELDVFETVPPLVPEEAA